MRAELYARDELRFEGLKLEKLFSARTVGRELRVALEGYVLRHGKEEVL